MSEPATNRQPPLFSPSDHSTGQGETDADRVINWNEYNNEWWAYTGIYQFNDNWALVQCEGQNSRQIIHIIHLRCLPTPKQFHSIKNKRQRKFEFGILNINTHICGKCEIDVAPSNFVLKAKLLYPRSFI